MSNILYGIIGGMGPATSAEFVNYVYSQCHGNFLSERDYPGIIMISDNLAPDRLKSFQEDNFSSLTTYLDDTINKLNIFEVDKIIICCIVAHACLNNLSSVSRNKIVNLIDLLHMELLHVKQKPLLLATTMLYDLKLVDALHATYIDREDIEEINRYIYKLKVTAKKEDYFNCIKFIESILKKYQSNRVIFACSDLHMVNQFIKENNLSISFEVIDMMELAVSYILNNGERGIRQ